MDIGALTTKGKPSWKQSTTNGKGKSQGKGRFCEYCKSTTHDTNYCWKKKKDTESGKAKGKGKTKSKSKGKGKNCLLYTSDAADDW